jgi:histidinol dehydrogenase
VTEFDEPALQQIAPDVERLADKEGLTAHARSVSIRTG